MEFCVMLQNTETVDAMTSAISCIMRVIHQSHPLDQLDNTGFSDEAHFYLNSQVNKGFTHVSWVQNYFCK